MPHRISIASFLFALSALVAPCQQGVPANPSQSSSSQVTEDSNKQSDESKRILGLIPNYRTSPSLQDYQPLSSGQKFKMASEDAFDRGTVALAVVFGADGQITNENRSFGARCGGVCRVLRGRVRRFSDRRLHDRGGLPKPSPPGSPLLSARQWERMVQAGLCRRADLLYTNRFRRRAIQLLGDRRKFNCRGNFECILREQPDGRRRRVSAWPANRRRHGRQYTEGILAGFAKEVQAEECRQITGVKYGWRRSPKSNHEGSANLKARLLSWSDGPSTCGGIIH